MNFKKTYPSETNLSETYLSGVNLSETLNLSGTNFSGSTYLSGPTFNVTPLKRKPIQEVSLPGTPNLSGPTFNVTPLKRKTIQEVSLLGSPIKQVKTLTGPVQKIYLQNENQTSQEIIIDSLKAEEMEIQRKTTQEMGVLDEVQPIYGDKVSKESGKATSDKRFQSTPKLFAKKKHLLKEIEKFYEFLEEMKAERTSAKETEELDETESVSRGQVSKESGEVTSDKELQTILKPLIRRKHRKEWLLLISKED